MSQEIRRELISKNLSIKPISHGQVYTFQVALPDSRKRAISLEQRQAIEKSLIAHQTNLVSLVIRRTDAYDDEDIEYELVYGADWLQLSQELDLEKVWAWVFDMTDEQMVTAIAEMESLTRPSRDTQAFTENSDGIEADTTFLIDKKLQLATDSIKNLITALLSGMKNELNEKLKTLNYRIDHISSTSNDLGKIQEVLEKLDALQQQLKPSRRKSGIVPIDDPINLLTASDKDIEVALKQVNTQNKHISAAIKAIRYWKESEQKLTWNNLEVSVKANTKAPGKIEGFAKGTYDRLQAVAFIPEQANEE
jgi:hypothetical protein